MIKHLHIKNFMCFKELEIPTLKRVNLIAGKNNSGKTTLLDAVRILNAKEKSKIINHVLYYRKLFKEGESDTYDGLFIRGKSYNDVIKINSVEINKVWNTAGIYQYIVEVNNNKPKKLEPSVFSKIPSEKLIYIRFNSDFDTLSHLWENVALTPKEDNVYEILRDTIQPDLIRLDVGREIVRVRLQDTKKPTPLH